MSRPKNDIGIKRIEYITKDDVATSTTMMNIMGLCNGSILKCTFNDHKGGIETRRFKELHFKGGNKRIVPICESWVLIPVRIHYKNGDYELGFKYWDSVQIVTRKNGKLKPFYIKDGYIDDVTGELVCDLDGDTGVPYRLLHELPFYNEKVRDITNSEKIDIDKRDTYDFSSSITHLLTTDFCVSNVNYSIPPNSRNKEKIPWVQVQIRNTDEEHQNYYTVYKTSTNDWTIRPEYPMPNLTNVSNRVSCYSYWKSMYVDVKRTTNVYGIIPMSDLYTIHREIGWKDEVEVWNNLDLTLIGEF